MSKNEMARWQIFKALGEPNRFQLLNHLCQCGEPTSVSRLAETAPQDPSVISRHLKSMREVGVVSAEKRGRETLYQVNGRALAEALRSLADFIENCECCKPKKGGKCCE